MNILLQIVNYKPPKPARLKGPVGKLFGDSDIIFLYNCFLFRNVIIQCVIIH